jgi:hypothetical protein
VLDTIAFVTTPTAVGSFIYSQLSSSILRMATRFPLLLGLLNQDPFHRWLYPVVPTPTVTRHTSEQYRQLSSTGHLPLNTALTSASASVQPSYVYHLTSSPILQDNAARPTQQKLSSNSPSNSQHTAESPRWLESYDNVTSQNRSGSQNIEHHSGTA